MKITITIPDDAVADVEEYCRVEEIDFQGRIQAAAATFIKNTRWWNEEKRKQEKKDRERAKK